MIAIDLRLRFEGTLAVIAMVTALVFGLALPAWGDESVVLSPSVGEQGSVFSITGSGFGEEEIVHLCWGENSCSNLGVAQSTDAGDFAVSVSVPRSAVGGSHVVTACADNVCGSATFVVIGVTTTTTTATATTTTTTAPFATTTVPTTTSTVAVGSSSTTASPVTQPTTFPGPPPPGDGPTPAPGNGGIDAQALQGSVPSGDQPSGLYPPVALYQRWNDLLWPPSQVTSEAQTAAVGNVWSGAAPSEATDPALAADDDDGDTAGLSAAAVVALWVLASISLLAGAFWMDEHRRAQRRWKRWERRLAAAPGKD